ncbi:hypothetical protein AAF712_012637 [Marasmius tenuissimus]|uniref:Uncharacterized protein n=1 Tax=Marasmius tenuissimus TaxID=585030 RepID=A0ABR2ZHX7_9AGAR
MSKISVTTNQLIKSTNAGYVLGLWDLKLPVSYFHGRFASFHLRNLVCTPLVSPWPFKHALPSYSRSHSYPPEPIEPSTSPVSVDQDEQPCPIFVRVDLASIAHTHMLRAKMKSTKSRLEAHGSVVRWAHKGEEIWL